MKTELFSILRCPYCGNSFYREVHGSRKNFSFSCRCGKFPAIGNLLILIKDDSRLKDKLLKNLDSASEVSLVWKCLTGIGRAERITVFLLYFLKLYFRLTVSRDVLIAVLKFISKNKPWYDYLLRRRRSEDFRFASDLLPQDKGRILLDVGCGTGDLLRILSEQKGGNRLIVGLDKSLLSLLIAKFYLPDDIYLLHCDLEQGFPCTDSSASTVVMLNSLPWIYNKKRTIAETARVLTTGGKIFVFNIFAPVKEAKDWGDGIFSADLKQLAEKYFTGIRLLNYPGTKPGELNEMGYNLLAIKKAKSKH